MNKIKFLVPLVLVMVFIFFISAFVVNQKSFGVVYRLGEIVRVVEQPGLYFRVPMVDSVEMFDKRLLTLVSSATNVDQEPLLTREKQRVVIDWYVRWRIANPKDFIRNVGRNEDTGSIKLAQIVRDSFQERINKYTVVELLATKREELMKSVKDSLIKSVGTSNARGWGIVIDDVRITRVDFVNSITDNVYTRMQAERKQVANALRSSGAAAGEKIRAEADREYEEIVAKAYQEAQVIKGKADAEANKLYSESFGQDPSFAKFYRNIEAYKNSLRSGKDVMVLDSSADFFKFLNSSTH